MTIDEAIKHAEEVAEEQLMRAGKCTGDDSLCDKYSNCMKCAEEHRQLAEWLKDYKRLTEQTGKRTEERTETHACDCISRQAVLNLFAEKCDTVRPYHEVWQAVKELPPVEPERKTGKIICSTEEITYGNFRSYIPHCKCSECNFVIDTYIAKFIKYCPNCGANMGVEP